MTRLLIPDVRGLPRAFWLLFSAAVVDRLGGFGIVYLSIWLAGPDAPVGLTVASAGLAVSLFSLGGLVGGPVGGALADRFGRKPVLVGALLGTAGAWLLLSQMHSLVSIAAATLLVGVCSNLGRPAMAAAIADVVPEEHRRRAFGLHYWAINLGFAFSAALAGGLARFGPELVLGLDAATSVLMAYRLAESPATHTFALRGLDHARSYRVLIDGAPPPGNARRTYSGRELATVGLIVELHAEFRAAVIELTAER